MTIGMRIEFKRNAARFWIIASSLISLLMTADAARADKRVAFVVGNGAYRNAPQLSGPPIDAIAMATTLRGVGFDVVEGTDLTRGKMAEKLIDFGKRAQDADVALFFYSGHGIAISGTNYLLPVDADIKSEMDVKLGAAINIDLTLDQTMSDAKVKLIFLDASRDNPFVARIKPIGTRGVFVQSGPAAMKPSEGTLIAFATGPGLTALDGQKGTSSPFTRALIANIATPGVEIQQAMTRVRAQVNEETNKGQMPWGYTNLNVPVYLNPVPASPGTAIDAATAPSTRPQPDSNSRATGEEEQLWRSVKESNDPEKLHAYLNAYPDGQYRSLALAMIHTMEHGLVWREPYRWSDSAAPSTDDDDANQMTEDWIGLNKTQRRDVQRRLIALGFDIEITGRLDHNTRSVIKRWQAARHYPVSGYLNAKQLKALSDENGAAAGSIKRPSTK